jgi:hypothetical protein
MFALILFASAPDICGQIAIVGELSHDRVALPGETYEGSIVVRNDMEKTQEAKVYATDYSFSANGTNNYAQAGTLPRSNAHWIEFSPSHLVIPPGGSADVVFRVSVPMDTSGTLEGSYWSMIMVEGIPEGSPESSRESKDQKMGIVQSIRYGIQIASHIGSSGVKNVRFVEPRLLPDAEGERLLQVDIENTGSRGMRPDVFVELFSETGASKGKYKGVRYRLYPGTSVRQRIHIPELPSGTYRALVVIDDGGNDVFGTQYVLEF